MVKTRVLCLGVVLLMNCMASYLAAPTTQFSLRETLQLLDNMQREKELEEEVRNDLAAYDDDEDTDRRLEQQDDNDRESEGDSLADKHPLLVKKANYMSLCHFKLCNMGKRTSWRKGALRPLHRHH